MTICFVHGCETSSQINLYKLYTFPKCEVFCKKWLLACGQSDMGVDNCKNYRICGKHFSAMQYKRDFRFELCGIKRGKNYRDLKEDAIPDQYLQLPATLLNDSTQFEGSGVLQQLSNAAVRSGRCPNSSLTQASPGGNKVKSEALEKVDPPPVLEVPAIYIKEEPEDVTEEGSIKEEPFLYGNELGGVD